MTDEPRCTCGKQGICITCVLAAFEKEEQELIDRLKERDAS